MASPPPEAPRRTPAGTATATGPARSPAERVIQRWSERDGVRVPVIVPAWMWGSGDAALTASGRLFLAVARGELRAVPRVGSQIADARDVA